MEKMKSTKEQRQKRQAARAKREHERFLRLMHPPVKGSLNADLGPIDNFRYEKF